VTDVDPLQQTLAAEHAAVYVLAALGGRAAALRTPSLQAALATSYDVHLARRDHLTSVIAGAGQTPVAAAPAYELPRPLTTASQINAAALQVERACVAAYAALVAAGDRPIRGWAVATLGAGALSELTFGGQPQPLPGLHPSRRS
jgi:hypothetical protein